MLGCRPPLVGSVFRLSLAVHLLVFTNVLPWLHTCGSSANVDGKYEHVGAAVSHGQGSHALRSRENANRSDTFGQEQACLACLLSTQLRSLSPPATVGTLALALTLEAPSEPLAIPPLSRIWIQLAPRAPPTSTPA